MRLFFVSLAENWIKQHYLSLTAQPGEKLCHSLCCLFLLNLELYIVLPLIDLMVLCELKDDGLVDLSMFTGVDEAFQIHTLEDETV